MKPDTLLLKISLDFTDEIRRNPDSLRGIINNCSPVNGLIEIAKRSMENTQQCCYSLENEGVDYGSYMAASSVAPKSAQSTDQWVASLVRQAAPEMFKVLERAIYGKATIEEIKKVIDKVKGLSIIKSHRDLTHDWDIIMPYKAAEVGSGKVHARLKDEYVEIRIVHDEIWYKNMSCGTFDRHLESRSLEGALHKN